MLLEESLRELIEAFWAAAGGPEPFPRSLEEPILWALPLAVVKLPRLCVSSVDGWLQRRGVPFRLDGRDRLLRGCLIAFAGKGFAIIEGTDSEDERRVSLAHESAHFLADYFQPRQRAVHCLGEAICEVLDGMRAPTLEERVSAILKDVPIGVHAHLMDRTPQGLYSAGRIVTAESRAHRLAMEMIAPAEEVRRRVEAITVPRCAPEAAPLIAAVLARDFGLPEALTRDYANVLAPAWYRERGVREWLGVA